MFILVHTWYIFIENGQMFYKLMLHLVYIAFCKGSIKQPERLYKILNFRVGAYLRGAVNKEECL